MREFGFELALCAHLEPARLVSRQLGAHVHGRRVLDTVVVEPGPDFEQRAAITPHTIPEAAIESDVGRGRARYWKSAFDCHPERAEAAVDEAVDIGFFEEERRGGRRVVRQTARYPEDWFESIVGIENKPDLDRPGDLERQLRTDVSLGLVDEVYLATASHVTGAHLNRIPEEVGVWRFAPETGEREEIREATPLPTRESGLEPLESHPGRTDVRVVEADEKRVARRRLAERAYGKGWRTYDLPDCARVDPDEDGLPYCPWKGRVVRPAAECGADCEGFEAGDPPAVDAAALRAGRTPWVADPADRRRCQAGLDRYSPK
ncbi:DUF5787 family protein [Halobacteriales archaeon Cl-PHB]